MSSSSVGDTLKEWASRGQLSQGVLSEDGTSLRLGDASLDATQKIHVEHDGKKCEYTLASIFLQILEPNQSLMAYRNKCKAHKVVDMIRVSDKKTVVGYFVRESAPSTTAVAAAAAAAAPPSVPAAPPPPPKHDRRDEKRKERHDRKKRKHEKERRSSKEHKRHKKDKAKPPPPPKKKKAPMTTEQMLSNLNVVVDKRHLEEGEDAEIRNALSAEGFDVTPELIKESNVQEIVSHEIPVGNSASILRPAPGRDFQRVLDLFLEATEPPKKHKGSSHKKPSSQSKPWLRGKKPVIILPKGMTAPLTMMNAHEFLGNRRFVPRDVWMKQNPNAKTNIQSQFHHKFDARRGAAMVEFELMDNPRAKLGSDPKEWDRIVAVIALGASWQFKDWPRGFNHPVDLFSKCFGFYVGLEGAKLPAEIDGWAVKKGKLSRDKRGLDSVCFATFWEGLEDRMVTKKPELLPQQE